MTAAGLDLEPYRLPLEDYRSARSHRTERRGVLVRLHPGDGGPAGLGEAPPLDTWTEPFGETLTALRRARERVEADGEDPQEVARDLAAAPAARHGLTQAVLDARARARDRPLHALLDPGDAPASVPTHHLLPLVPADALDDAVRTRLGDGAAVLKVKLPADPDAALDRLRRVRDVAPDVRLRADASAAWSPAGARRVLAGAADLDLDLLEQPLPQGTPEAVGALEEETGVPLALDEDLNRADDPAAVAAAAPTSHVVVKAAPLGGVQRAWEVAQQARAAGAAPVVTTTLDALVGRLGAVHLRAALGEGPAAGLATGSLLRSDLGPDPASPDGSRVPVPDGPGLGIDLESVATPEDPVDHD